MLLFSVLVLPEMKKRSAENASSTVKEENSPLYCRILARITPLIIGPIVCPTSIMVLKKPMDVPIKLEGVSSHMSGAVEEITMEKPKPYPIEIASSRGNDVVNGITNRSEPLMMQPSMIGMRLLVLSENRPIMGLDTIRDTIWTPITMPSCNAL